MKKFLLFASLALASFGQAQHWVEYGINLSLGESYYENYANGETPSGPIQHQLSEEGYGSVGAVANVGFGVNKARVDLAGTNPDNPLNFEYGFASSRYFDSFTLSDPELNGTIGTFTTTLYVQGSGHFSAGGGIATSPETEIDGFWHAVIGVDAQGLFDEEGFPVHQSALYAGEWYKGFGETEIAYYGDELNTYQAEATFEFVYGEPIFIDTFLQTLISVDNQSAVPGTFDASIDLGNSAYWGGMTAIRDARGNLVSNVGYSSSSGFNYMASAVPEPASMSVLGPGLAALIRRRR